MSGHGDPAVTQDGAQAKASDGASLLSHTWLYLLGRIATGVIGLVTLAAFTRVLSPEDYGRYSVILAVVTLVAGVGFQWLRQGLVRFGTGHDESRAVLLGTLGLLFGALAGAVGVAAVLARLLGGVFGVHLSSIELAVIFLLTVAQAWFEFAIDAVRTEFRPWCYSAATFVRALLCLVLGVAAAVLTHSIPLVLLGIAGGYVAASLIAAPRWLGGLLRWNAATWQEVKRLASYGLPLAATLGMTIALSSIDRLMLAGISGYSEAGVYASAYDLAQFSIGTILAGLGLGSLPLAIAAFRDPTDPQRAKILLDRNLLLGVGVGLPAVIGLAMIAPALDRLLLGNYVAGRSDTVTVLVAVGTGFAGIRAYCLDVVFMLYRRTWVQAFMVGGAVAFNVLLNLLLIPRWGAVGAASASLLAFVGAMAASGALGRYYLKLSLPVKDVGKILLGCIGLACAVSVGMSTETRWLNLALTIIGGAIVYASILIATDAADSRTRVAALFRQARLGLGRVLK